MDSRGLSSLVQFCAEASARLVLIIGGPTPSGSGALGTVTVIHAGKLSDPESGRLLDHPVVVDRICIESVSAGNPTPPAGAHVVDLGDARPRPV